MAKTTFEFEETEEKEETTDIKLCANRWKLWDAIIEVDSLLRGLVNEKIYETKYLCPVKGKDGETGEETITTYMELDSDCVDGWDKAIEFVPVDYIVNRLERAIDGVCHLVND